MKITISIGKKQAALFAAFLFIVLSFASAILFNQPNPKLTKQIGSQPAEVLSEKASNTPTSNNQLFKVTRVIDGDTIEIEGGQKVRYIGIDTPETVHPQKPVQCFGIEASNKNKELVEGRQVRLEKDVSETDKYGRLLRYVYIDNTFINKFLVAEGYAHASSYPPDIKYQDQLQRAQDEAQQNNKGLWSNCTVSRPENLKAPSTSVNSSNQTECKIKGNISSSGEKIYHIPGQRYYDKTVIDETKGEKWFCSEQEAVSAGWRKSKM